MRPDFFDDAPAPRSPTPHYSLPEFVQALKDAREDLGRAVDLADDLVTADALPEGVDHEALEEAMEAVGTTLAVLDA